LIIGRLEDFAAQVNDGLEDADWTSRRGLIRALVKRVEVDDDQVHVVVRVDQRPGDPSPEKKVCNFVGGVRSPILAKVYWHYALDLWLHQVVKPRCRGEACLIRYADDCVCAVQHQGDAERFYQELGQRHSKLGLEVSADKTRGIPCSRHQAPGHTSFDCLGIAFRWGQDRTGKPHLKRRTSRKKLRNSLKRVTDWCKEKCRYRRKDLFRELKAKLRGYDNDYGVKWELGQPA
jgi:hypothetical protein